MNIGIISDTHDDIEYVKKAITVFEKNKVSLVIHGGDYVSPSTVKEFERLTKQNIDFFGIFGNHDLERSELLKIFHKINGKILGDIGEIEKDGVKFGIYHGTDEELKQKLIDSDKYDVFIFGHTHEKEPFDDAQQFINHTLILNPGTAHSYDNFPYSKSRCKESTVIIFDTISKSHRFIDLSKID